jgi:small subunit ribosomal protein S16
MAIKMRMDRIGRRHRPFFRINIIDSRNARNGTIIEKLGHYDPIAKKDEQVVINLERAKYWIEKGAIPSDTVAKILGDNGIESKHYKAKLQRRAKAKSIARAKGKPFTEAERKEAEKKAAEAAEKAKADAEAKEKAEQEKAKAEEEKAKEAEKAQADEEK